MSKKNWQNTEYFIKEVQKEVQKNQNQPKVEILKLCIVKLLDSGNTARDVAYKLNMKKSALSYYLSSLKRNGILKYSSYGTWEIKKEFEPKEVQKSTRPTSSKIGGLDVVELVEKEKEKETRGHGFTIKFKLRDRITNWSRRGEILTQNKRLREALHPKPLQNGKGWRVVYRNHKIHLWNKSIIIFCSLSFLSKKASESKSTAIDHFITILRGLERMFGCQEQFKYRGNYTFTFSREHYGLVRNLMARQYNKDREKLRVANMYGVWCLIDDSFNLDELETVKNRNPDKNDTVKNAEGMQEVINSYKNTGFTVTSEFVLNVMNGIQQNQLIFDKNMKSHLNVLNKIGCAIDRLGRVRNKLQQGIPSQTKLGDFCG